MSLPRAWMLSVGLLLVVGTPGCGDKPEPVADTVSAAIEKLGGKVDYDDSSPERPVVRVLFFGSEVTDAGVNELRKALPNVKVLH